MTTENKTLSSMKKTIAFFVAALIIVGGGAFYGGIKYNQYKNKPLSAQDLQNLSPEARRQKMQQLGLFGGAGGGANSRRGFGDGGFVSGEVIAKDDKGITVKLSDGGSKIIFLSKDTEVTKSTVGAAGDLEVGKQVSINGAANQDGSVTAKTIQIRPDLKQ